MRKTMMLLVAVAAMLTLVAGTALARSAAPRDLTGAVLGAGQVVNCAKIPCYATGTDDLVNERVGDGQNDTIYLRGGDDRVNANTYRRDRDVIKGSQGYDLIYVDDGDTRDKIYGGKGRDKCYVDAKSEVVGGCGATYVR